MVVKVGDPGMSTEEFFSPFSPLEALLTPLLSPCRSVVLQGDGVIPSCGDHLLVVDVSQAGKLSNRGFVAAEPICMDDLWDTVVSQQPGQEGLRRFGVPMPLEENALHETVFVHSPPQSMPDAVQGCTHLVQMPPRTPTGFSVAQVFSEEGCEFDAPFAEGLVTRLLGRAGGATPARLGHSGGSGGRAKRRAG
jgi:hypothetical protein